MPAERSSQIISNPCSGPSPWWCLIPPRLLRSSSSPRALTTVRCGVAVLAWGMLEGCCEPRRGSLIGRSFRKRLCRDSSSCFVLLLMQILSKKVFTLYSLAMQQLSKQDHYDFGLRSLTSLLRYAGRKRRTVSNVPDEEVGQSYLVASWSPALLHLLCC